MITYLARPSSGKSALEVLADILHRCAKDGLVFQGAYRINASCFAAEFREAV